MSVEIRKLTKQTWKAVDEADETRRAALRTLDEMRDELGL